jgi:hypothetical protein
MARFNYDVDKITRYIDVHKQFQGGLKTVDTDDSLRDVYLREAENVSLSEFNFVEKRYGLHKLTEYAPWVSLTSVSSIVQGYFEYYVDENTLHKIIVIEGHFYVDQGAGFQQVLLFSSPTGEVIDLSDVGIYAYSEQLDAATSFASNGNFGTQAPWFYSGNPNGVQMGLPGNVIHSTNNNIYLNNGSGLNTSWINPLGATFPFPSGLTSGAYYLDTRTNKLYQWNNGNFPSPTTSGLLTLLTEIYAADIQTTRPVEGVRIDDKLYIATGTYPVYYKGDGKIYVFEQYQASDIDLIERGYDLNTIDIDGYLNDEKFLTTTSSFGTTYDTFTTPVRDAIFKESVKHPFIPYQIGGSKLNFKFAYHLYNNGTSNYWTSGDNDFDSTVTPAGWDNPWVDWTLASSVYTINNKKFELRLSVVVYKKIAGTLEYTEVPTRDASVAFSVTRSGTTTTVSSLYNNKAGYVSFPFNVTDVLQNGTVQLSNLNAGNWDYKLEFRLAEGSFRYVKNSNGTDDRTVEPEFYVDTFSLGSVEYTNILVTSEKLEDYTEPPLDTLRVHSCNRIIEHNGRLCLFGNTQFPDYLFFSDIASKNYFPYRYSLQFSNDLQESVTAVNKFMNILVVQSPSYTWGIKGDSPFPVSALEGDIYRKITINPTIGCIAPHSVKNVRNQLYFLSKEGIFTLRALFAEDLRYNVDPIDRNIYNIVPRDETAIAAYFDDQYWLQFPQTGETLRYYVDKKAWVKDTYAAWEDFGGVFKYINDSGKLRFLTQLSQLEEGNAVKIFEVEVDYTLPTDLTKIITSKMTTSYLNQNYPFHPKNYKEAKFDFAIQNEYNTSLAQLPIASYAETINYVQFTVNLIDRHFYSITFLTTEINSSYPAAYTVEIDAVSVASGNITLTGSNLSTIRFMSNKGGNVTVKITVTGKVNTTNMSSASIKLYDSTYDQTVTFNTLVLSEEGTLNVDPIASYVDADVEVPINLGTQLGNWTFGTSNFGNVIVAIKTVKLSGRGYNSKISIIEDSKSKWTLESLGITYKMKKARSR